MLVQGLVGQPGPSSNAAGANPTIRQGQLGDVIVSELHGRYYETAYRRNMFSAALTAATTNTAALPTAITGLLLYNPPSSTINVALNKVSMAFIIAWPAAAAVGLQIGTAVGALTGLATSATVRPLFGGLPNNSGQALAYSGATVPTAGNVVTIAAAGLTGLITVQPQAPITFDMEGSVVLPPGTWVATYSSTVSGTNGMWASFTYEEIPL